MREFCARFAHDESGATAMEYGLALALISLIVGGCVRLVGDGLWRQMLEISGRI